MFSFKQFENFCSTPLSPENIFTFKKWKVSLKASNRCFRSSVWPAAFRCNLHANSWWNVKYSRWSIRAFLSLVQRHVGNRLLTLLLVSWCDILKNRSITECRFFANLLTKWSATGSDRGLTSVFALLHSPIGPDFVRTERNRIITNVLTPNEFSRRETHFLKCLTIKFC